MSRRVALFATLLALSCGCAALVFSSPYDPAFDAAVEKFRKDTDVFFTDLEAVAGTPEGGWERFDSTYRELGASLDQLTQQALVRRGNTTLLQSLDLVRQNLATCEQLHREGMTPAEVAVVRRLVDTQVRMLLEYERARPKEAV